MFLLFFLQLHAFLVRKKDGRIGYKFAVQSEDYSLMMVQKLGMYKFLGLFPLMSKYLGIYSLRTINYWWSRYLIISTIPTDVQIFGWGVFYLYNNYNSLKFPNNHYLVIHWEDSSVVQLSSLIIPPLLLNAKKSSGPKGYGVKREYCVMHLQ